MVGTHYIHTKLHQFLTSIVVELSAQRDRQTRTDATKNNISAPQSIAETQIKFAVSQSACDSLLSQR